MKYLILEKGNESYNESRNWKLVESNLPYEQFRMQCVKYALYGGDWDASPSDYGGVHCELSELHIIELPTLLSIDLVQAVQHFQDIHDSIDKEEDIARKRRQLERLKSELGEE